MNNLKRFQGKDNALLVEFEMMVDTDMGLWRYIKENFYDDPSSNREFLDFTDEVKVTAALLAREVQNPLALITPLCDYDALYMELMTNHELEILQHSDPYSLFGLMRTLNEEASSVKIDVLCQNTIERTYVEAITKEFDIVISPKKDIDASKYSAIYMKYISSFKDYPELKRHYIYVANAGYNIEPEKYYLNLELGSLIEQENVLKSVDPYLNIKYINMPLKDERTTDEEESDHAADLLEHSQQ